MKIFTLNSAVPVSWSSTIKIKEKGFNWRLIGNSYLVLCTRSAEKFEQVSSTSGYMGNKVICEPIFLIGFSAIGSI